MSIVMILMLLRRSRTQVQTRICTSCKKQKSPFAYRGARRRCSECDRESSRSWRSRNPDKAAAADARRVERGRSQSNPVTKRRAKLKSLYGLSLADYAIMEQKQGGACAICLARPTHVLHVDHDHVTGAVRGLLCAPCNLMLGGAKDRSEVLRRGAAYLETAKR